MVYGKQMLSFQSRPFFRKETEHYENMPIQIYWKVNHRTIKNFQTKKNQIFFIFLLKI